MRNIDFFVAGWPKTGSTSLHYYLGQHPDIFMSKVKDNYFYSTDIIADCDEHGMGRYYKQRTEEDYVGIFDGANEENVWGDSSVFYTISEVALDRIKEAHPNAKIIVVLRDPIELLDSWFWYLKQNARESAESLEEALDLQDRRKVGECIPPNTQAPIHLQYDKIIDFPGGFERIFKCFDKSAVKITFYDDFKQNREKFIADLFDFLDVRNDFCPDFTERNVSRKIKFRRVKSFVDRHRGKIIAATKVLGLYGKRSAIQKFYVGLFTLNKKRESVSAERRRLLRERCNPMVKRTSELLDVDLESMWGYK